MASFIAVKKLKALYACDEAGEAILRTLGQGELVEITLRRPRNVKHHRLFFALISLCWEQMDNRDDYPTPEDLLTEIKIVTGHYTKRFVNLDGKRYTVLTPKSISFAAMEQPAFEEFFERCCLWIVANVLPGVTQEELRTEIEVMVGIRE